MNNNNTLSANKEKICCQDYCTQTLGVGGQQVVNAYACNGRKFTSASLWNIQRKQRSTNLRFVQFDVV